MSLLTSFDSNPFRNNMFILPVLTLFLLAPIYTINKKIFIGVLILECILFFAGYFYITMTFEKLMNKTLYFTALGGGALILAFIGFFVALFSNQKHLYNDNPENNE